MRKYIEDACEEIDAAMFSGDAFLDSEHREALKIYINRWTKEMIVWEKIETHAKAEENE